MIINDHNYQWLVREHKDIMEKRKRKNAGNIWHIVICENFTISSGKTYWSDAQQRITLPQNTNLWFTKCNVFQEKLNRARKIVD